LIALIILVIAIAGLALLGLNYLRTANNPGPVAALATPTVAAEATAGGTSVAVVPPTVGRSGGLQEPEQRGVTPTQPRAATSPAIAPHASPTPTLSPAESALQVLQADNVPARDLYSIAARLKFKSTDPIPHTTGRPAGNYAVGHSDTFFISDLPNKRYYTVTATIRDVTDHAYWYTQDGRGVDKAALQQAANTFESKIYPTDHRLFGTEWSPGVDNDPRITVLFVSIPGAGGYFSSADEYTRAINPYSNEREIIYINIDGGWTGVESTLAHEFQHMIHWHTAPNHDVWINEGSSVLASDVNGYDIAGVDEDFMRQPDTQLNAWQPNASASRPNYGAAFLFLDYLRTHYGGDDMIRAVVAAPGQGTEVIDNALKSLGKPETFDDVFQKWVLANLLDGKYGSDAAGLGYPDRQVGVSTTDTLSSYPADRSETVSQFGTDYIELDPPAAGNTLKVSFSGQPDVPVIAAPAHSGQGIWWSNRGDLADSSMTRTFDLSGTSSATLDYYIWLDTESDLDYGYVEASTDGGATWDTLQGAYTTATNPNGTNFGNGYTGKSQGRQGADQNGWLHEQIDISKYAGKQTQIRFEYITDDCYNAGGVAVDDISIPQIGYKDDAETDRPDGWQTAGFVRVADDLPQSYYVAIVKLKGDGFQVQPVTVSPDGKAEATVTGLGTDWNKAILVVAGMTPHNIQQVSYSLKVQP